MSTLAVVGLFTAFIALTSAIAILTTRDRNAARRESLRAWSRERRGRFVQGRDGVLGPRGDHAIVRVEGVPVAIESEEDDRRTVVRARARFVMGCGPAGGAEPPPLLDVALLASSVFGTTEDPGDATRTIARHVWSGAAEWREHVLTSFATLDGFALTEASLASDGERVVLEHTLAPRADLGSVAVPLAAAAARLARFGHERARAVADRLGTSIAWADHLDHVEPCARLGAVQLLFGLAASEHRFRLVTRARLPWRSGLAYAGEHGVLGLAPVLPPGLDTSPAAPLVRGIGACTVTITANEDACLVWLDEQEDDVLRAGAGFLEALASAPQRRSAFR